MWREGEDLRWRRLLEKKKLDNVEEFLHYITFMHRLFCYGRLFKEAVHSLLYPEVTS
jgi:hypothetical protein